HGPGPDGGPYGSDAADGLHAPGSADGVDGSGSAGDPHGTGLAGAPHASSARGTHPPASADGGVPGPGPAGGPQVSGHADGGQQPGSVEGVPGPGPDAGPYASDPADGTTVAASGPARAAETVDDEPVGAEEAPEGPAEHSAHSGDEALGGSGPEAAEGPLAGPAPAPGPDHAPEPARAPGEARPRPDDPAGDGTGPGDADPDAPDADADADADADTGTGTGTGTGTDETRTDPADPEAVPAPVPVTAAEEPPAPAGPQEEHPLASYVLRVNGADRPVTDAWIGESLLYVLRERLGLAGAKDGCSQGECGACNVQVDGRLVASCLVPAVTSANSEVRTVEGLATDGRPSDVQRALARRGAVQCGFCVPGMAMTVHNLLEGNPAPTELEARQALCGNLCRCSGYRGVLEAVQEVVAEREAHADDAQAGPETDEPRIPHQAGPGAGGVNPSAFEPQPPQDARDATGPHDPPPYGDHGDHDNHGQDGGHA
ncbi:2Fe-2S iron-sulfur cluster-binding protein, partial [Streptomyces coelicoflavus]|uniref:2Fe-2S iron-sulfur cluster-binding protein n=1 Tax=Streptomyces coelicoflavus TaxID=285562 RepID=UPI0037FD066C